jgi:pyruvate-formate lyase-activating enzyme
MSVGNIEKMSIIANNLIKHLMRLIRKRKVNEDFYLTDLKISADDEMRYEAWAKRRNEMVLQKFRARRKM